MSAINEMIFYKRGRLSLLIVTSISFIMGMLFHHLIYDTNIHYDSLNTHGQGFQYLPHTESDKEVLRKSNVIAMGIKLSVASSSFKNKLVHLDLKGAPPKISYLESLLPFLKKHGATGLLIEYEDCFPFEGEIYELSSTNPYTKVELKKFLSDAASMGFDIIPLVQTFGHMEFALKLLRFKKLRENSLYPNNLCPSQTDSMGLIKEMISQIVSFHKEFHIKRLHIGCDEVYHLAECEICSEAASKNPYGNWSVFLNHVKGVAEYVRNIHGLTPIIWDDMLRKITKETISVHNLQNLVEIMIWTYGPKISKSLDQKTWFKYKNLFRDNMWAASAFKGATGVDQMMTSPKHHLGNHQMWIETAAYHIQDFSFKGIAITGWQRYDHFSVLCELLPVAIPSLIFSLVYLKNPKLSDNQLITQVQEALKCSSPHPIDIPQLNYIADCNFPGSSLYKSILNIYNLKEKYEYKIKNSHMVGWMSAYHISSMYTNPDHVRIAMKDLSKITERYLALETMLVKQLNEIYTQETIDEWFFMYFQLLKNDLQKLDWNAEILMSQTSWPRRYFSLKAPKKTKS